MASLLGLSLLLVRAGFWASLTTVVEDAGGMHGVLIAIQTEPTALVYGAIIFLLLVGFALLDTHLQMEEMGHRSLGANAHSRGHKMPFAHAGQVARLLCGAI